MLQKQYTLREDVHALLAQRREARQSHDPGARQRRALVRATAGAMAVATAVLAARYNIDFAFLGASSHRTERSKLRLRDRVLPVVKSLRDATSGEKIGTHTRSRLLRPALDEARKPEVTRRPRALALAGVVLAASGIYPVNPPAQITEAMPAVSAASEGKHLTMHPARPSSAEEAPQRLPTTESAHTRR